MVHFNIFLGVVALSYLRPHAVVNIAFPYFEGTKVHTLTLLREAITK